MPRELKQLQLNLLGELPASTVTLTLHLDNGVASREYWITGEDDAGEQVCLWSSRTSGGPGGGVNLAEVMQTLHQVLRATRGLPLTSEQI